ncbi:glycosyl hydrolases family 11-domain-containing protein [Coprinopsis sp. MPI-PUGE-AT-0042]|nr:glycosyl hydrolases family 11-domain-containing protein [Coprinopsis sp. MPI-PUGE-AT-0042]KAH6905019.1 glycosyl hydrolases family 11-domain-containing protein [Coprinopsis sp. MPI-PUGE-AT-0042]
MVSLRTLLATVSVAVSAFAAPSANLTARGGTPSAEGTHDGFFYSWWTDNGAQATYTNGARGNYAISWGSGGNLVGGKGWNPGTVNRVMTYGGNYQYSGNSYLAVYGWTRNPLIEYYIVENFGSYDPSSNAQRKGTVTLDGSVYDIAQSTRTNQPSIDGTQTFQQFWSVRKNKRSGGTVDVGAHFRAWANAGLRLGSNHYYQIMACEGYFSSGNCNITVTDVGSVTSTTAQPSTTYQPPTTTAQPPTTTAQPPTTTAQPQPTSACAAQWGQCGGNGWTGPTCCQSGSTCKWTNDWFSQCLA